MRAIALSLLLGLLLILPGLPSANAAETGTDHYTGTLGGGETSQSCTVPGVNDGTCWVGFIWCDPDFVGNEIGQDLDCVGGAVIEPPSGASYVRAQAFVTDEVMGANAFFWGCLLPSVGVYFCQSIAWGCGLALEVAPGVPDTPANSAWVVVHTLQVDASTSEVCGGVKGAISVVFVE